jgi:Transposase
VHLKLLNHNNKKKARTFNSGKHCSEEKRKLIQTLRNESKNFREIVELLHNAVKYDYEPETRGRKHKTDSLTDRIKTRISKKRPFKSAKDMKIETNNVNISLSTIRRRLNEANLFSRQARKVPLLSKRNIKARIEFAKLHRGNKNILLNCAENLFLKWKSEICSLLDYDFKLICRLINVSYR